MSKNVERKATIVSIVPFPINEFKPGIYPGQFDIPASFKEDPEVLHVGYAQYYVEIDEDRTITVKVAPEELVKSIVEDYVTSNLAYNAETNCAPGIFWLPGQIEKAQVSILYSNELKNAKQSQYNWFLQLIKMADDDWEKTGQHKTISDMQRYAAKALNLERPWVIVPKTVGDNFQKCVACASLIIKEAIVCPNCKCIIDKKKYDALQFVEK